MSSFNIIVDLLKNIFFIKSDIFCSSYFLYLLVLTEISLSINFEYFI
jgi:hypothetical protein